MTERERLIRALKCEEVDRIPVAPFIYKNFVKEFYKDPHVDIIEGTIAIGKYFGFDLMLRPLELNLTHQFSTSSNFRIEKEETHFGDTTVSRTSIHTPERVLTETLQSQKLSLYHEVSARTEWFIKQEEDLDQLIKYMPPMPKPDVNKLKRAKTLLGENGVIAPYFSGVFNVAEGFRKLDDLLVDPYENEEFYNKMMNFFQNMILTHLEPLLEEGLDVVNMGGNIANGSVTGPRFFEQYIFNYEKKFVEVVQSRGAHVLYHNCGDGKNMIDLYNRLGIHAFETMTEAPYADMNLKDSIERFDPNISLIGNIDQITFLKKATPDEVRNKVKEKLEVAAKRPGFILGTSDFIEENTPHKNLFAMAEAVKQFRK